MRVVWPLLVALLVAPAMLVAQSSKPKIKVVAVTDGPSPTFDLAQRDLATEIETQISDRYEVELVCHLVSAEPDRNLPEPELLLRLSRFDSAKVAPHYGLRFPENAPDVDPKLASLAVRILAATEPASVVAAA